VNHSMGFSVADADLRQADNEDCAHPSV